MKSSIGLTEDGVYGRYITACFHETIISFAIPVLGAWWQVLNADPGMEYTSEFFWVRA
jgi:hypothetical protein